MSGPTTHFPDRPATITEQPPRQTARQPRSEVARISSRLNLAFAILTCLGGLVLASGTEGEMVPTIAVFFAIFGFVFVDWLRLFSLPPVAAYAAMGLAALFCVGDFFNTEAPSNHKMIAVAQLLVLVQAIMMLQTKSRRIFEQLGIFCLLELVVAAVFNNAIHYGLLLVPICIVGGWAMTMLASVSTVEGISGNDLLQPADEIPAEPSSSQQDQMPARIEINASHAATAIAKSGLRLPRIVMLALTPSVVLIATIFFYALPRTTEANRVNNAGNALVGFSTEMRLEQIGQMAQNAAVAAQVQLHDRTKNQPYQVIGDLYLRGAVLENYHPQIRGEKNSAFWKAAGGTSLVSASSLPIEFFPDRASDVNFYDTVSVEITCESSKSSALFAIAPYHKQRNSMDVVHQSDRWTLARKKINGLWFGREQYGFGTHAFRGGIQSRIIARDEPTLTPGKTALANPVGSDVSSTRSEIRELSRIQKRLDGYTQQLMSFDRKSMPGVDRIARSFLFDDKGGRRNELELAQALTDYLARSGDFQYSLNLNAKSVPGMDPIEQFVSVDRRGHCQYYASALTMMLRSQNVPARLVVGYRTDEQNELSGRYVARQLHAHAWVEALIPREQIETWQTVYGQPKAEKYWVRLDPTPPARTSDADEDNVGQVLDLAQTMWDDYVVDMDADRQGAAFGNNSTGNAMQQSYSSLVNRLSNTINQIRAGELGGGSLASGNLFSWPAAVAAILVAVVTAILIRIRSSAFRRRRKDGASDLVAATPSVAFYSDALDQLGRVGVRRMPSQTPIELTHHASDQLQHPLVPSIQGPLETLTDAFYRVRFGTGTVDDRLPPSSASDLAQPATLGNASSESSDSTDRDNGLESQVNQALADLSRSVDLMTISEDRKRK